MQDIMLLLGSDMESAILDMATKAKRNYVNERHTHSISHMTNASGYKKDKWKTYVGKGKNNRKEIIRKTEDELYDALFDYYMAQENKVQTLTSVFEQLCEYKSDCLSRRSGTISEDIRRFNMLSPMLQEKLIIEITDEDIQKWIVKEFLPTNPKPTSLKKTLQLISQIFDYGIRKKLCLDNPMKYISINDYMQKCDLAQKSDEEKKFSAEELALIRNDCYETPSDPYALMTLLASYSGLRIGELASLHKSDVQEHFLHVHTQQLKDKDEDGHQYFFEVPYTKDERMHPHDGRSVPITEDVQKVLNLAAQLPGDSEYVFHNKKGRWIYKDAYLLNLRRRCSRLRIQTTNNHAFRMAYNDLLIQLGISPADRALIMGHEVQTNEAHYSLTDKRRLEEIRDKLIK